MCGTELSAAPRPAHSVTRRGMSVLALGLAAGPAMSQEAWPARPVRLVIPFAPGGPIDTVGRMIGERLRETVAAWYRLDLGAGKGIGRSALGAGACIDRLVRVTEALPARRRVTRAKDPVQERGLLLAIILCLVDEHQWEAPP